MANRLVYASTLEQSNLDPKPTSKRQNQSNQKHQLKDRKAKWFSELAGFVQKQEHLDLPMAPLP
jgi:hypothetical protein